jgi:hypothetical protein
MKKDIQDTSQGIGEGTGLSTTQDSSQNNIHSTNRIEIPTSEDITHSMSSGMQGGIHSSIPSTGQSDIHGTIPIEMPDSEEATHTIPTPTQDTVQGGIHSPIQGTIYDTIQGDMQSTHFDGNLTAQSLLNSVENLSIEILGKESTAKQNMKEYSEYGNTFTTENRKEIPIH